MNFEELQVRFDELAAKQWRTIRSHLPARFVGVYRSDTPYIIAVMRPEGYEVVEYLTPDLKSGILLFPYIEEVPPYADWPIDTKILVSRDGKDWKKRYFAGVDKSGHPAAFADGATSWSASAPALDWPYIKIAEGNENE